MATEADFLAFFAVEPPPIWFGMVAMDRDGDRDVPVAFGSVVWDVDGAAWVSFDKAEPMSATVMHRTARRTIALLKAIGEPTLYATCRDDIQGARKWLERLGFSPDPDRSGVLVLR